MNIKNDKRVVMTLDAGGTNFVFSAIQGGEEIITPIRMPANADDLDKCMSNIISGFKEVKKELFEKPVAISFAFPGPADYPSGIISDLPNLPAFRGGIALGPMLEEKFKIPVYINNDGNLYAYGESISGLLPELNAKLKKAGSPKRYKNLVGFTLGTGFGCGLVIDGNLIIGDNSNAGEGWLLKNKFNINQNIEQSVSIRAIKKFYAKSIGIEVEDAPEPERIYKIGEGLIDGDKKAAKAAFSKMGEALGDGIASILTMIDGIAVIGGGVSGAASLFLPEVIKEMNSKYQNDDGSEFTKMVAKAFNLDDENQMNNFSQGEKRIIKVPLSDKEVLYDPMPRVGVGVSKIGTSKAIAIGAYAFALSKLDK